MHIFLQGPSKIGKSTLLREALAPYVPLIAGFVVQRLTENGAVVGYRAVRIEGEFPPPEAEYCPELEGIFISRGLKWDAAALNEAIMSVRGRAPAHSRKLILLDEIGGVELGSRVFMGALEELLAGEKPCFGVFKSRENFARAARNLGFPARHSDLHRRLEDRILSRGEIIELTGQSRPQALERLKRAVAGAISHVGETSTLGNPLGCRRP